MSDREIQGLIFLYSICFQLTWVWYAATGPEDRPIKRVVQGVLVAALWPLWVVALLFLVVFRGGQDK